MKWIQTNFFRFLFLLSGVLLTIPATLTAQTWQPVGTEGFGVANGVCNWQQLLISDDDTLYISFNDEGSSAGNGHGNVMKFDGTNWVSVGAPNFTPGIAHHSSFTFGGGDTLYFSFADGTAQGFSRADVMMYDGNTWSTIGNNLTTGECQYSHVQVDAAGNVYLGMIDNGYPNGAMVVKKYDGNGNWSVVGSAPTVSGTSGASNGTMVLDRHDTLYVAYRDKAFPPGKLRVKKFNGTSWVSVDSAFIFPDGVGIVPPQDIYLGFDLTNTPFVSYSSGLMGPPRLTVVRHEDTGWAVVGTPQFSSGTYESALFSSMALPKNAPYVAFQHGGLNNKASVMKYDLITGSWVHVGPPAISDSISAFTSIALDGNGNIYVAFFDAGHDGKNTVLKYTTCEAAVIQSVSTSDSMICQGGDPVTLSVTGTLNDATSWNWYADSCGGALVGTGSTLTITPLNTTTYYVRGLGGCVVSGGCARVPISLAVPQPQITLNNNIFSSSAVNGNQWYHNGTAVSGATGQQYTATQTGWYYVVVTEGNCSNRSDSLYYEPNGIVVPVSHKNIHVSPNPFYHTLQVTLGASIKNIDALTLTLTNMVGQTVYKNNRLRRQTDIALDHLPQGIYFLNIQNKTGMRQTFKVVKIR